MTNVRHDEQGDAAADVPSIAQAGVRAFIAALTSKPAESPSPPPMAGPLTKAQAAIAGRLTLTNAEALDLCSSLDELEACCHG